MICYAHPLFDGGQTYALYNGNDYGATGYGGPCPPKGLPAHRYIFTVHALGVPKLELPANAPNAVARFVIYQNTLATATLTGLYNR